MEVPIFVGRKRELATMESLYSSSSFEMLVLYGRRRAGKTALIEEFAKNKNVLYFTAQLQADADNLFDFSHMVIARFDHLKARHRLHHGSMLSRTFLTGLGKTDLS